MKMILTKKNIKMTEQLMQHNNNSTNPRRQRLSEGLQYRDLDGIMKSTVHVDEFTSKMGDDADIIVLSFFVRDLSAAKDLVAWFEKGYDFVMDADRSPGEIKPSRFLVYVEIRRRRSAPEHVQTLLDDLSTLTEFDPEDWTVHYEGKKWPWNPETFAKAVPCTPDDYRRTHEEDLNEMRAAAGLATRRIHEVTADVRVLQAAAGII
jgi:hypothetical protein